MKRKSMILCLAFLSTIFFAGGCISGKTSREEFLRREGVVDAIYTVMEHSPEDSSIRIENYLFSHVEEGNISEKEKDLLVLCLKRTQASKFWSGKEIRSWKK